MILSMFAYRSRKLGCFAQPFFSQFKKEEIVEQLTRSINSVDFKEQELMKEMDLYYLGTYDDKHGIILQTEVEYIVDCSQCIITIPEGGSEDGKDK